MTELENIEFITTQNQTEAAQASQGGASGAVPQSAPQSTHLQNTQPQTRVYKPSESELRVQQVRNNFGPIALATLIYAFFYTFCLYKNLVGVTFPIFVAGTFYYLLFCMKTLEIQLKKDAWFYIVCSILLGISTFTTDSAPIQVFNFIGILLLIGSFMVHHTYEDGKWDFAKYLGTVFYTAISAVAQVIQPFVHFNYFLKNRSKKPDGKGKYVWYGILITVPLLLVVLALLASADMVFDRLIGKVFEFGNLVPTDVFGVLFLTIFAFFAAYSYLCAVVSKDLKEEVENKRTGEPVIAITFTSALTVVYLVFSLIQVVYLFVGGMQIPYGHTYAEYARQGYFQLLFVCLLNLVLVLVCLGRFREHKVLKVVLTVMSGCTYIMIASSIYRMMLYVSAYCLTFTRVLVIWSLIVLMILLTGIVISIFKPVFPLFRFCMIVVTCSYLCLSFSHQDYFIAKYNLTTAQESSAFNMDYDYLYRLSADKYPAMVKYMNLEQQQAYNEGSRVGLYEEAILVSKNMSFRTWNLSKYIAGQSVK